MKGDYIHPNKMVFEKLNYKNCGLEITPEEATEILSKGKTICYRKLNEETKGIPALNTFFRKNQLWWTYTTSEGKQKIIRQPFLKDQIIGLYERHILLSTKLREDGTYQNLYLFKHEFGSGYVKREGKTFCETMIPPFQTAFSDIYNSCLSKAEIKLIGIQEKEGQYVWALSLILIGPQVCNDNSFGQIRNG